MILLEPERELALMAAAIAGRNAPLTPAERAIVDQEGWPTSNQLRQLRLAIKRGEDPLGDAFRRLRCAINPGDPGGLYTPRPIVDAMVSWAAANAADAVRVVDPGAGSGRFLLAAGQAFPAAELIAVEIDPVAALTLRANAAARGLADRLAVVVGDYRDVSLPEIGGATLFLGNPPHIRHRDIAPTWREWFADAAAVRGLVASRRSNLHVHFFLRTLMLSKPGDYGVFITSAEWFDVDYGDLMRHLLLNELGGTDLHVLAPTAMAFADAAQNPAKDAAKAAVISCFRVGAGGGGIRFRAVDELGALGALPSGREISRSRLEESRRWTPVLSSPTPPPARHIELGELRNWTLTRTTGST